MTEVEEILLHEVREMRREIKSLDNTVTTLKVKFGMIALFAGFIGSFLKPILMGQLPGK